jgi:hypothetical protein
MAILGGAGNPVGGSFTGPAEALEIYGDFAAAYSGTLAATTSPQTAFSFTTGNYLFVGELQLNAAVDPASPADGSTTLCITTLNGTKVSVIVASAHVSTPETFASNTQKLIIPAYTEVVATIDSAGSFAYDVTVTMTGRIYRQE